jgi:hypothetical protein
LTSNSELPLHSCGPPATSCLCPQLKRQHLLCARSRGSGSTSSSIALCKSRIGIYSQRSQDMFGSSNSKPHCGMPGRTTQGRVGQKWSGDGATLHCPHQTNKETPNVIVIRRSSIKRRGFQFRKTRDLVAALLCRFSSEIPNICSAMVVQSRL